MDQDREKYLSDLYYDTSGSGGLGGIDRLYRRVKREGKFPMTRGEVKEWLMTQDAYTLHKPARKRFPRNIYFADGIDQTWQMDLIELQKLAKFNKGHRYILVCIDVFSKYAWARPLKDKKGPSVRSALQDIFEQGRQPTQLQSDKGKEFLNKDVRNLLKERNVHFFTTQNPDTKAAIYRSVHFWNPKISVLFLKKRKAHRYLPWQRHHWTRLWYPLCSQTLFVFWYM